MMTLLRKMWLGVALIVLLVAVPVVAQTPVDQGPYAVGLRLIPLVDASRGNRNMLIALWYPAVQPDAPDPQQRMMGVPEEVGWLRAVPDLQEAPYPLILYSHGLGGGPLDRRATEAFLASHGYVVVGLAHVEDTLATAFVDRPIDVIFTLDQLAAMSTGELAGLMDTQNVGMMGDSFGAYTTLLMTGARIDPAIVAALESKPTVPGDTDDPRRVFPEWNWDQLAAYRAPFALPQLGDASSPLTDLRIRAAVMNSPCWAYIFGEKGLAAATVPSLIVSGTRDVDCRYEQDSVYIFTHLGSPERHLLSFVNSGHVPDLLDFAVSPANQFLVAFFDTYLKGQQDAAQYLTTEYVETVEAQLNAGLLWGRYNGE
jgi:predicted dienelactone hydrolase